MHWLSPGREDFPGVISIVCSDSLQVVLLLGMHLVHSVQPVEYFSLDVGDRDFVRLLYIAQW